MQSIPQTAFLEVRPFIQHLPGSSGYSALISRQTGAGLSPSGSPKQHTLYQIQNNTKLTLNTTTVQNVQLDMHSVYPRQLEISHTWIYEYAAHTASDQQTCTVGGYHPSRVLYSQTAGLLLVVPRIFCKKNGRQSLQLPGPSSMEPAPGFIDRAGPGDPESLHTDTHF